jgi:hypothetical protein
MKTNLRSIIAAVALLGLAACSTAQNTAVTQAVQTAATNLAQDAATAQAIVNTAAPVVNQADCDIQAAANKAGAVAAKTGNPKQAQESSDVSTIAGALCLTPAPAAATP